jgi:hypothetical protein
MQDLKNKIHKIFEDRPGAFKPLVRAPDAPNPTSEPAENIGQGEPVKTEIPIEKQIIVSGNKLKGYTVVKTENKVEKERYDFPTLEMLKPILKQITDIPISYKVSNEDEQFLTTDDTPEVPKEEPLSFGSDTSNLLNNRTEYSATYVPKEYKDKIVKQTITDIKTKLNDKLTLVDEIKSLKTSESVDPISKEYMNSHVFLDKLDDNANIIRYINYLIYSELDKYIVGELLQNKSESRIKRFGGNYIVTIRDIAKEIIPLFNRILTKKDKSELFNAYAEAK